MHFHFTFHQLSLAQRLSEPLLKAYIEVQWTERGHIFKASQRSIVTLLKLVGEIMQHTLQYLFKLLSCRQRLISLLHLISQREFVSNELLSTVWFDIFSKVNQLFSIHLQTQQEFPLSSLKNPELVQLSAFSWIYEVSLAGKSS